MKRLWSITGGLLGLLALGALVVALALTFGGLQRVAKPASQTFQSPIQTPTQPPYPPPGTPTPSGLPATPTAVPMQVPLCTFTSRTATAEPASPLGTYKLSKPQVVLTHTSAIEIAGWLPNSQQLLITKDISGTNRQVIELFNTRTREESAYAERHSMTTPPVWLTPHKTVAFIDSTIEEGWALRLSHNSGGPVETLQTHLASPYLAVDSASEKVAFLIRDQAARPVIFDLLGKRTQPFDARLPFALRQKAPDAPLTPEEFYRAAWEPKGNRIAFYNQTGLYLLDLTTGQTCRMELGLAGIGERGRRWAYLARWSPNGRYLAMITTSGRFPLEFSELTILDTSTGGLHSYSWKRYVLDIAWAPDGHTIAARGALVMKEGVMYDGLYLISAKDGSQSRQLPKSLFTGANAGLSLSWSSDGRYLAVNCPTSNSGRLCQIAVTK